MYTFRVWLFGNEKLPLTLCLPRQDKAKRTEQLSRILQSTRDHLELELNRMEAEKAHLAAHIQVCVNIKYNKTHT